MSFSVTQHGIPLDQSKYSWDENTKTFSSLENSLVLDFSEYSNCTFDTGYNCTFKTGSNCTFDTGYDCTFDTGYNCTFKTGSNCTFDTGSNCTFDTGYDCTFDTGYDCTFKTGSNCTFDTGYDCTFDTGYDCVIIRRDIFQIIQPKQNEIIMTCPYNIDGFLSKISDKFYLNRDESLGEYIIIDGILSKVVSKKENVYKVINHNDTEISYIINHNGVYSHGKTLKEAKESLIYKLADRDTTKYENLTLDSNVSKDEAIQMYMTITGACAFGTRSFVESVQNPKSEYSIRELIDLTEGQYGHQTFNNFFNKN